LSRILTQAAFTITGTLAQGLVRIAIPILVGRHSDEGALAEVSLVLSVSVLLSMAWPTPAGVAASRFGATGDVTAALRTLRTSTAVALPVLGLVGGWVLYAQTGSIASATVAIATTVSYSAYFFVRGVFLGRFHARALAAWEVCGAAISVAGTVASLLLDYWPGALWSLALGYVLIALVGWPRALERSHMDVPVLGFTALNAVAGAASNGLVQLAMIFAFATRDPTSAGLFAAAFSIATPTALLGQTLNQVLIPHLASTEPRRTTSITRGAIGLVTITSLPFLVLWIISPVVVELVYGDAYANSSGILRTLVLAMFLFTLSLYPAAALTAWGRPRLLAAVSAVGVLVGVPAMAVFSSIAGVEGTGWGLVVGTGALACSTWISCAAASRSPRPS
jgi:O-antigen/teichoic acid export membrane protein